MKIQYSESASQLMEQSFLSIFAYEDAEKEWDLSNHEKELLGDALPILEEIRQLFQPYKERIETYYLTVSGSTLLQSCYAEMSRQGLSVEDMEDLHEYCLSLDEASIQERLKDLLDREDEDTKEADFWTLLDLSTIKPANKWYFSHFYNHAETSMANLVELSRELVALYQPYLKKAAEERRAFAESLSQEKLQALVASLSSSPLTFSDEDQIGLYIVSPWLIRFIYNTNKEQLPHHWILASCRIDKLLLTQANLDTDSLTNILKTISDATRYQVLVELTKPYAKSKDIAKTLGITGAAVSFHTQKLLNSRLLLVNQEDKHIKYNINRELLEDLMRKLEEDFKL